MTSTLLAEAYGSTLDYSIIIIYFVAILGFGTFFGRYAKSTRDFFFGGQKFSWWLIAMSMVATGVGSYSFIKYSAVGFTYGMSSSMTYMNDWFFIPFFMFGWLPIIYFSRVRSIPEYFQRRFNTPARVMAVVIILAYMLGYIGFNLYTLGVAAKAVLDVNLYYAMLVIAIISAIYITVGGQTAVIFTDLVQGFMLLGAGAVTLLLGLDYLGADGGIVEGIKTFWAHLGFAERLPFAHFNRPPDFNFVGVFWQDGVASSITFLFINQGLMDAEQIETVLAFMQAVDKVLGVMEFEPPEGVEEEIATLLAQRDQARKKRDFARADAIREQLRQMGVQLIDTPSGTRWRRV